ncbi:hypothetical protein GIS00_03280 [Nakamurella sp. YIM 132087]|uniref:Glycerophosphoryl diester phosphodiesterase membrane domain-containing protein n=1 Tax=Nakamurella alba TaxID=2665158 RepID=A0A7K1FFT4_9ACTN|nr:hypothetical protein [Nakamurella alba]MTD12967.1 hypothetical protein [Nakamurella alba]
MTSPGPYGAPFPSRHTPQPGMYPLRPLAVGEILTGAVRVAWRHLLVLAPIALLFSAISTGVQLGLLSATGMLEAVATGSYAQLPAAPTAAQLEQVLQDTGTVLLALLGSVVVTQVLGPVLAGIAAPFTAEAALSTKGTNARALARLNGRWGVLLGSAVLAGLATAGGFLLLLVPGILLWIALAPAGPVAAMEGTAPAITFRRALHLSRGFRPRIFGTVLLQALFVLIAAFIAGIVAVSLFGVGSAGIGSYITTQIIGIVVGAFTGSWTACVVALLYVDLRMRREGLAEALQRSAQPPTSI